MTILEVTPDTLTANVVEDEVVRLEFGFQGVPSTSKMIPVGVSAGTPQTSITADGTFSNIAIGEDEPVTFGAFKAFFRVTGSNATVQFVRI